MDINSFVQAIIDDPHDIHARMVLSDYLDEIGDPRAEMIRLQFQLAEMPRHDPARRGLRARELELVREHGCFGEIPPVAKFLGAAGGFIDAIEITVPRFLKHQQEIFARSPIRKVVFKGKSKRVAKLADSPYLGRLTAITLKSNDDREDSLLPILRSDRLNRLEALDIRGDWVTAKTVRAIAASQALSNLTELNFDAYQLETNQPIQALAESPHLTNLQSLGIRGASDETCGIIANAASFQHLNKINVQGREITTQGMRWLHTSDVYPGLESLTIDNGHYSYLQDDGQPRSSPFEIMTTVRHLTTLDIVGGFGSRIISGILRNFPDLEVLRLSENRIDDNGAIELAQSDLFRRLQRLYLTNNQVTAEGAAAIGEAKKYNKSIKLFLDGNPITRQEANGLRARFGKSFLSRDHMYLGI